jgi:hypothetical protein
MRQALAVMVAMVGIALIAVGLIGLLFGGL